MSVHAIDAELVDAAASLPRIDRTDVAQARRIFESRPRPDASRDPVEDGVTVRDDFCLSADGHRIALRLYTPHQRTNRAVIYQVHGGGFILGDLEMNHARNREIAQATGALVVAVDYRLAPEWRYPAPLDDVYSGLVWVQEHAADLDVDPALLAVHAQSAGSALAVSAVALARDRGRPAIGSQFLASPLLDDRLRTDSGRRFTDTPALTRRDVEICWDAYLGEGVAGGTEVPAYAVPARMTDLADLPRTYIAVAQFDPLRDEAIEFAQALLQAGVPVELHLFPGTYHGSSAVAEADVSRRERGEELTVLSGFVQGGQRSDRQPVPGRGTRA